MILKADRQAVANVLVEALIENLGTCPSKLAMEQLAKNLVNTYPSFGDPMKGGKGWRMWFNHSIHASAASGFLEERLKNQRKRLAKKKVINSFDDESAQYVVNWDSDNDEDDPEPDEKVLEYLKHNSGEDTKSIMKNTVFQRRTIIRRLSWVENILERKEGSNKSPGLMPRLFDTEGNIVQDFNIRHPNLALIVYERWPKASKLLFQYAVESDINFAKILGVSKPRYDLTDDDILILAYCLLPYILPFYSRKLRTEDDHSDSSDNDPQPKKRKKSIARTKKARNKPLTMKASQLDCSESLILFRPKNTSVASILAESKQPAPHIVGFGTIYDVKIEEFFVIINKTVVPCGPSFMVALDTCLKSTTVLYIPPPIESYNHWMFMQHGIAGKPADNPLPLVQALIGQIMPRI
ncbi:uncharacterized protein LOC118435347 isoform X2 [Folsomia candida]|nr:uncharacterized protein LOC118435347 isoform X2 [Folsomia candida]